MAVRPACSLQVEHEPSSLQLQGEGRLVSSWPVEQTEYGLSSTGPTRCWQWTRSAL